MLERGVQMIYLTATLSLADEAEFMDIIKVQIPDDCKFRACTSWPNIAYSVVEHDIKQTEAVCQLVADKLQQYPALAKIIVYSSSIDTIKELGSALNCYTYYANVGSTEEKEQIQRQWGNADRQVVVASNAFGLGIDQPDVRGVIHVRPIYQIQNYGQESGRGGRDGQRCKAIILVKAGRQEALQAQSRQRSVHRAIKPTDKAQIEQEKVDRFINKEQCQRIYLDQEMDGRIDRVRCEDREEQCNVCQRDDQAIAEAEALRQAYIAEEEEQARYKHDQMLDSSIIIPSSDNILPSNSINIQANDNISPSSSIDIQANDNPSRSSSIELLDISRFASHRDALCSTPKKNPSSSIISSNLGFTADLITIAKQYKF